MSGPTVEEPVLVIGDSLTAASEDELHTAARGHGVTLHIRAEPGRSIGAAVPVVQATTRYSEVVIALGTNDVGAAATAVAREISRVLASAGPRHVWWVDVGLADMDRSAHVNAALERAAQAHDQLELIRWSHRTMADPSLLSADGVHLTDGGRLAFAAAIIDAMRREH